MSESGDNTPREKRVSHKGEEGVTFISFESQNKAQ